PRARGAREHVRGHVRYGARAGRSVAAAGARPDRAAAENLSAVLWRSGGQGVSSGVGNFARNFTLQGSLHAVLRPSFRAPPPSSSMAVREPAARVARLFIRRSGPPLEAPRARGERAAHHE